MSEWRWSLDGEPLALRRFVDPDAVAAHVRLPGPSGESRLTRLRAVYQALAGLRIGYAYAALSGEAGRQVIRPPTQVVWSPRHATCLDLALVLAAGCLKAGLHPAVVVLDPPEETTPQAAHALVLVRLDRNLQPRTSGAFGADVWPAMPVDLPDELLTGLTGPGEVLAIDPVGLAVSLGTTTTTGLDVGIDQAVASGARYLLGEGSSPGWGWRVGVDLGRAWRRDDVLRDLPVETTPWVQAPAQLPRMPNHFAGRAEELEGILRTLTSAGPRDVAPVALVYGPPGSGKSALAAKAAHEAAGTFPDGQLYVSLRGTEAAQARDPHAVLESFLRGLGVPADAVPGDSEERAALYRSLLASRRVLVVLDDARTLDQVELLLPVTSGSAAIVTSRTLVSIPDVWRQRLDVLGAADSVNLIAAMIGPERAASDPAGVASLADLCGYWPLALRLSAARLARRTDWSIERFLVGLREDSGRLDGLADEQRTVRASFQSSYQELPKLVQRAFRLLSLPDTPDIPEFAVHWLLALPGQASEPAQGAVDDSLLGDLVDAQLLESTTPGRYRYHDLLKVYARELVVDADAPRECVTNYLSGYARWASSVAPAVGTNQWAEAATKPAGAVGPLPALELLQSERETLTAAVRQAAELSEWQLVIVLVDVLNALLALRPDWSLHEELLRHQDNAFVNESDSAGRARALNALGSVRRHQGRLAEAIVLHKDSLGLAQRCGDRVSAAHALTSLGVSYRNEGRWSHAIVVLEEALRIAVEDGQRLLEGQILVNLGNVHEQRAEWSKAEGAYRGALAAFRASDSRHAEGAALAGLGIAYERQGLFDKALKAHEEDLAICRDFGDRLGEAQTLINIGVVHGRSLAYGKAVDALKRACNLNEELCYKRGLAKSIGALGAVYAQFGLVDQAVPELERARVLCEELGDPHCEAEALVNLGPMLFMQGKRDQGLDCLRRSRQLFAGLGDKVNEGRAVANLAVALGSSP